MIANRNIIYISSIEWNFLWQTHQEIVLRLAAAGNRVLYIENTGVRTPVLGDARRVWSRLKRWVGALATQGIRRVAPNIYVCSPFVLPPFGSSFAKRINRRVLLPQLGRTARRLGMRKPLLWTYMPTDTAVDLIEMLREPESTLVYYCVADFSQLTPHVEQMLESERGLIEKCDLVFTMCAEMASRFKKWKPDVHVFPGGVNLKHFPLALDKEAESPLSGEVDNDDGDNNDNDNNGDNKEGDARTPSHRSASWLASLPKPVIGYAGGLHRLVDYELLLESARAHPHWSWVFVGSRQMPVDELAALPNVYLLGERPHGQLADYIRQFDVCIVPYIVNDYARTVVPTKINEYLAMGKPVVSTELPTVCEFNREHSVLSTCAAGSKVFLQTIERELQRSQQQPEEARRQQSERRREVAALADWRVRLEAMSALIEACEEKKKRCATSIKV